MKYDLTKIFILFLIFLISQIIYISIAKYTIKEKYGKMYVKENFATNTTTKKNVKGEEYVNYNFFKYDKEYIDRKGNYSEESSVPSSIEKNKNLSLNMTQNNTITINNVKNDKIVLIKDKIIFKPYNDIEYNNYQDPLIFTSIIRDKYKNTLDIPDFSKDYSTGIYFDKYCIRPELDICAFKGKKYKY